MTNTEGTQTMNFSDRVNAAPTHIAYFSRGGSISMITQTMGEVVEESPEGLTIASAATEPAQLIHVKASDLVARKDGGERITPEEWDEIFRTRGAEQTR